MMNGRDSIRPSTVRALDDVVRDLKNLREDAGDVPYAEIVRRIAELRRRRGYSEAAAAPARSTVYNAFASGRRRMDTSLLRDIVLALGQTEEEAAGWVGRARDAQRPQIPEPPPLQERRTPRRSAFVVAVLLLALTALNHASHWFLAASLDLPVYLDMVGTAVAALALGPWYGVAVAAATGLTGPLFEDGILGFTLVNIAGALVWGYGAQRFRLGRDVLGFFSLNLAVATVCSVVATPILVLLRGGAYGTVGQISDSLQSSGMPFLAATFTSNISTSILDKLLTGFIALALIAAVHRRIRLSTRHLPLVDMLSKDTDGDERGRWKLASVR